MAYQYIAVTGEGRKVHGVVDAPNEGAAEEMLWGQQFTILSLREVQQKAASQLFASRIKTRDLIVFSRQLATLIESGIPLVRSLFLLKEQMSNKRFVTVLNEVTSDVQQGRFFSEAILKHQKAFPPLYGRLIEIGERAGNLEMVLRQLSVYLEKEEALVRKVRGAMSYPAFVLTLAVGVIFLMLTVALPPLMEMFLSFEAELPLPTRILIALTSFFSTYKFHIVGGIAGLIVVFLLVLRTEAGHILFDGLMIKIPLVGRIVIQGAVARMCRSISSLLQAGIALPEIMEMVIRTQGNRVISKALQQVHSELLQGHGLSDPLAQRKIFPSMLIQMVRVGEETGSLDSNMETLAGFYEDEVDRAVTAMTSALEPALTIFIGLMVGFVAVSVIMPMYSLMGAIQ
jgi:type IV pilus assembly protein PilC